MSDDDQQPFISYRSQSDEFEIAFYGGPLDGGRIRTDVFPDRDRFVHRVLDRQYTYRYWRVSKTQFRATLIPAT